MFHDVEHQDWAVAGELFAAPAGSPADIKNASS
jgi:phenylpyruvate tautomerase PptA (4-oxalocrotonate tautomerase family)